jgi:tRNA threonylcarbamoyladenosine biosynthesis protein TsaE
MKDSVTLRVNERELRDYGIRLADSLRIGSVVALIGDLGTGKTTLTKAIAEGLGVADSVTSPTFTLINEYGGGRLPLYHFDVYRLGESDGGANETKGDGSSVLLETKGDGSSVLLETKGETKGDGSSVLLALDADERCPFALGNEDVYSEMDQLGWEDYFYGKGVCVVEWADMIEEILPKDAIRVTIAHTDSPGERILTEER